MSRVCESEGKTRARLSKLLFPGDEMSDCSLLFFEDLFFEEKSL